MTEPYLEQRPLLCDECSDEELHNIQTTGPRFQRRLRLSVSTGRARTHAKGASRIITRWPDHLSSLLTYWWVGLGMIAVIVFVIYNSIIAVVMLPQIYNIPSQNNTDSKLHESFPTANVYMHVFVSNNEEFNINYFVPYIEAIAVKYSKFNFNFIVVTNDTHQYMVNHLEDEQKNEIALNSLWTGSYVKIQRKLYNNFTVKFISLSKYLDNSPLKKFWRLLPYQFIGFMTRAISVWDKGGVAFNPLILTPYTPNSIYLEKLHGVLGNFQFKHMFTPTTKKKTLKKSKKILNNIRDIINNLQNEEKIDNTFLDNLSEAENIQTLTISSLNAETNKNPYSSEQHTHIFPGNISAHDTFQKNNFDVQEKTNFKEIINNTQLNSIATKEHVLPNFFNFLFHRHRKNSTSTSHKLENSTEDISVLKSNNNLFNNQVVPGIATTIVNGSNKNMESNFSNYDIITEKEKKKLIIDLKGNLIATEMPCHAFIGTIFSNILHHTDSSSVSDFIINELSLFCKGSLSICDGVDVILL